jgi:hypothetical protein
MAHVSDGMLKRAERACRGENERGEEIGSVPAVKALLESGFPIDQKLDEHGRTFLYFAVLYEDTRLLRFLLKSGADKSIRSFYGTRPIDIALENGNRRLCRLLAAKPEPEDVMLDGVPEGALDAFFRGLPVPDSHVMLIVAFNRQPLPAAFSNWMANCSIATNYKTGMSTVKVDPVSGKESYLDGETGLSVSFCNLEAERLSRNRYKLGLFVRSVDACDSYILSEAEKKYGYWFCKIIESGYICRGPLDDNPKREGAEGGTNVTDHAKDEAAK